MIKWIFGAWQEAAFKINRNINFGQCDCVDLLFVKPPAILSPPLDRLEDVAQLLDGARSEPRALGGEGEPQDGPLPPGVDQDILDRDVLRLALDRILERRLA